MNILKCIITIFHKVLEITCFILLQNNPCPHPIIFMRDCEVAHVRALLQFMYAGQVNIAQAQLSAFLRTADALQIRGLTDCSQHNDKVVFLRIWKYLYLWKYFYSFSYKILFYFTET